MINIISVDPKYKAVDFKCPHCGTSYKIEWWEKECDYYREFECYNDECEAPLVLDIEIVSHANCSIR